MNEEMTKRKKKRGPGYYPTEEVKITIKFITTPHIMKPPFLSNFRRQANHTIFGGYNKEKSVNVTLEDKEELKLSISEIIEDFFKNGSSDTSIINISKFSEVTRTEKK